MLESKSADVKKLEHMNRIINANYNRNLINFDEPNINDMYRRIPFLQNMWLKKFYSRPEFMKDREYRMNYFRRFTLILCFTSMFVAGYYLGYVQADQEDTRKYVPEMEVDEQIYSHLINDK